MTRHVARNLTALAVLAALSAGCSQKRPEGNALIVGMALPVINLDPRVGTDEASQKAHQLLFNTLLRIDNQLRPVPDLAESLEQPDPVTYIARLRQGVLFHNGRELTADDVVYTFRSFLDPAFRGRTAAYRMLAAVNRLDRYSVEFKLKTAVASFPINLVMGIVQDGSGGANARQPIGTGPYRLAQFVADDRLVLTPFEQHYAGRPRNDGLVLKVIPDDTMRGLELRNGSVDLVVNDLSPDLVWELRQEGRMQVATAAGTDYAYLGLNLRDPILSRLEVRKAIGYAIDRDAIVKYLRRGFATTAVGILPPMSWAFERNVFDFTHDPAEAARLLDGAGYRDPDGDGPQPRFRLSLKTSTSEVYRLQAAAIQHDLARVGIAVADPVLGIPDVGGGRAAGKLPALLAPVRRRDRPRHAAARVSLAARAARRPQPRVLPERGRRSADRRSRGRGRRRRAAPGLYRGPADHRAGRALHQPLVQDERRDLSARRARRHALPDRRFHVPERCVSRPARRDASAVRIRRRARACAAALSAVVILLMGMAGPLDAANRYDPRFRFRTISTPRFNIYFHQGEEALARRLARIAEEVAGDAPRGARRAGRPRARHPRGSDRPLERLGDADAVQPDRDHRGRAVGRQLDWEHR